MFFLALLPFVVFVGLLFLRRSKLIINVFVALPIVLFLAVFPWRVYPAVIFSSFFKGVSIAFDILLIVFGSVLFLEILKKKEILRNLCLLLERISLDYRVQVILLAWFLENFLEGTAGFGTPSTVVAPILFSLGLPPLMAVSVSLLGNSTSVAFGAAGTPITVGFAGLGASGLGPLVAGINFIGLLVPVFMLWAITRGKENPKQEFKEALPFSLFAGFAFVFFSYLTSFLGQEFPSIVGSILGLSVTLLAVKYKFLVPKKERRWLKDDVAAVKINVLQTLTPYAVLILFLLLAKFGWGKVSPGIVFIVTGGIAAVILKSSFKETFSLVKVAIKKSIEPFLVIAAMSFFTQIMINSGENGSGLPSLVQILAGEIRSQILPFLAPFFGAFGSFLTGSATISNIMFGGFLSEAAKEVGLGVSLVLALQLVGGAAGNMISLADILPAQAVLGIKNKERAILAKVIIPCFIYVFLAGLVGIILASR